MKSIPLFSFALGLFALASFSFSQEEKSLVPSGETVDKRLHSDGNGWKFFKNENRDPKLPNVLLIGDSIVGGYKNAVIESLAGKANVDAWSNAFSQSEHYNKLLVQALAHGPYDVIHFNMGLHGWKPGQIKDGTFEPLTKAYIEVIRKEQPNAKIIWASTTPVTVKGKPTELDPEINPLIIENNRKAAKVMKEMNVPINDFYSLLVDKLDLARGDQFHWNKPAYDLLAKAAADSIAPNLPAPKK